MKMFTVHVPDMNANLYYTSTCDMDIMAFISLAVGNILLYYLGCLHGLAIVCEWVTNSGKPSIHFAVTYYQLCMLELHYSELSSEFVM